MSDDRDAGFTAGPPGESLPAVTPAAPKPAPGLSADDLVTLNDELAGMAKAGLPLDQGLAALAKDMRWGRLRKVTAVLAADLKAGKSLPEALAAQKGRMPPYYAGLVAAGVRSGRIGEVLALLTLYARTLADLRATVVGALLYPGIVALLGLLIFGFITYYLVPQFESIFTGFRMRLPLATEWLLAVSHYPLPLVVVPAALLVSALGARVVLGRSERGRVVGAKLVYAIPLAGSMVRAARLAGFTDLLGLLVDQGVPLPEALELAGEASADPLMRVVCRRATAEVQRGVALSAALASSSLVPQLLVWLCGLGEKRGTLGPMLHQAADMYRRRAEARAVLLRTVLPPLFIFLTALVLIGIFVVAIALPMIGLMEGLSGGFR